MEIKKYISVTAIFLMFVIGCSNEMNINNPTDSNFISEEFVPIVGEEQALLAAIEDSQIDSLSASDIKEINGITGGVISIVKDVMNSTGEIVKVNARFSITAGAFDSSRTISMRVNVDSAYVSFQPAMIFNQYCKLEIEFRGVNLTNLGFTPNTPSAYFVYFHDSGLILPNINEGITYNYSEGILKVHQSRIYHFSRYGFIRKD